MIDYSPKHMIVVQPVSSGLVDNSKEKVEFRQKILNFQEVLKKSIDDGELDDVLDDCILTHYFTDKSEEYGCHVYAREMFIPAGTTIVGKIHKHGHLNFISKGVITVATEFGNKTITAPATFISEPGLKRAVHALEDTVWTTVHLTGHGKEEDLDKIEQEVISPTYEHMNLISNTEQLAIVDNIKGDTL